MQYERCTRRHRSSRVAVAAIVCFVIAVAASNGIVPAYASTPSLGWLDSHYVDDDESNSSAQTDPQPGADGSPNAANSEHPAETENRLGPWILLNDAEAVTAAKEQIARDAANERWRAKREAAEQKSDPDWDRVFSDALVASSVVGALVFAIAGGCLLRAARKPLRTGNPQRVKPRNTAERR